MTECFCKWLLGGCGIAFVAMGGYIVKQHLEERKLLKEWLKSIQTGKSFLED